jgi:GNAT superfamily N-acetyltransferase
MAVFTLDASGVERRLDEVVGIIVSAYNSDPATVERAVRNALVVPGFRLVAIEARELGMVGIAYGKRLFPGLSVYLAASHFLDVEARARWLDDAFLVVELAVRKDQQARGFGVRLLNNLLAPVEQRTALLPVRRGSVAQRLCERHGWEVLVESMQARAEGPIFALMGRDSADRAEVWDDRSRG